MSDFNVADLHESLPHEVQSHDNAVQQVDSAMLLDDQSHVVRPPEFLDRGFQQDSFFDNAMLLDYEPSLERPPDLLDYGVQPGFMSDNTMPLDDQPPVEQTCGHGNRTHLSGAHDDCAFARSCLYMVGFPSILLGPFSWRK